MDLFFSLVNSITLIVSLKVFIFMVYKGDDTDHHLGSSSAFTTLDNAMATILRNCVSQSGVSNPKKSVLALGIQISGVSSAVQSCNGHSYAYLAFMKWMGATPFANSYDIITDPAVLRNVSFTDYQMIYLPSQKTVTQCSNKMYSLCDIENVLVDRKQDIKDYINIFKGSIMAFEQSIDTYSSISCF